MTPKPQLFAVVSGGFIPRGLLANSWSSLDDNQFNSFPKRGMVYVLVNKISMMCFDGRTTKVLVVVSYSFLIFH